MATAQSNYRLLVVDDHASVLEAHRMLFRAEGFLVDIAPTPERALAAVESCEYEAILLDMNFDRDTTSGQQGLDLLENIRVRDAQVHLLVMTAWGSIRLAVEALRRGACEFVEKPSESARLIATVRNQAELCRLRRKGRRFETQNRVLREQDRTVFIAHAPLMRPVVDAIAQVGPSLANVLITGEHGTGKEIVAQRLHALSLRSEKPLITVNTGGLPEGTFESELFGHVKGAFTDARTDRVGRFEMAEEGTLFLDEIANVPLRQQAKLLRVLETGDMERVGSSRTRRVDVRILSATNADLHASCASGTFREDLLFRLNTIEIHIPPLRKRREDIPELAAHFLVKFNARYRKCIQSFCSEAMTKLMEYSWPGNVRELQHTIERAVIMCREGDIESHHLGLRRAQRSGTSDFTDMSLEQVEALLIGKALARYSGKVSQAAEVLGLSRGTFYRRMEKYGLYTPDPGRRRSVEVGNRAQLF